VHQSPDLPTYTSASAVDETQHRLYVVGPDESGLMAFHVLDTRTGHTVLDTASRLTTLADDSGAGINPNRALLTPDAHTLVVAGWVFTPSTTFPGVAAFDTATGRARWTWVDYHARSVLGADDITISADGRHAFVAIDRFETNADWNEDCVVMAFDVRSGRVAWHTRVGHDDGVDQWPNSVTFAKGRLIVLGDEIVDHRGRQDYDGFVAAFDPGSGHRSILTTWDGGFGDDYLYAATMSGGNLILTGETAASAATAAAGGVAWAAGPVAVALDPQRLRVRWVDPLPSPLPAGFSYQAVDVGGRIVVSVTGYRPRQGLSRSAGVYDAGYVRSAVSLLDSRTGNIEWTEVLPAPPHGSSWVSGLAVNAAGRSVYAVGTAAETGVTTYLPGAPGGPGIYRPDTSDAVAYAIDMASGELRWAGSYNADPTLASYATTFASAAAVDGRLFAVGEFDARSTNIGMGTVNGLIAAYAG
jgi:outer membrane protein assembly factor BamB